MCSRDRTQRKTFGYCPRYGEYMPELGVKIAVVEHQGWWTAICNSCSDFRPASRVQDDVVRDAMQHHQIDHPRDLVAFSINP